MGQACPGLACVVVELHEAEDQVCGHELKLIRWVRDHIPAQDKNKCLQRLKFHDAHGRATNSEGKRKRSKRGRKAYIDYSSELHKDNYGWMYEKK